MSEQRHPAVPGGVVRLTEDAVADLFELFKIDPQIVRWALKKMLLLERDPHAGEPLLGGLIGYRKITVGARDWRVVWRVVQDAAGRHRIEVAEVWAVGYRKDGEVYAEIERRIQQVGESPATEALVEVLGLFAKQARGLSATPEPIEPEPVPRWLSEALRYVVRLPVAEVDGLTLAEAEKRWADHIAAPEGPR